MRESTRAGGLRRVRQPKCGSALPARVAGRRYAAEEDLHPSAGLLQNDGTPYFCKQLVRTIRLRRLGLLV
jgi:hypothetical protein